jgi:phenylacetate-coenzyme A ligase PaaK-like adenylate-forming protein
VDSESLYLGLPVFFQNVACSVQGWKIQRSRFGRGFESSLREAEARLSWTEDRLRSFRDARLQAFVRHCAESVPYYRRLFHDLRVDPGSIRTLEDLRVLPVLDKATVQERSAEMVSERVPARRRVPIHTSGTTGGGLQFVTTQQGLQEQYAIWWRYYRLRGLQPGTWCGYFGGRSVVPLRQSSPPFWRYNYPGRQILFSAYHLSPDTFKHYVAELQRARPPWLHGYPSLLALLGSLLLERNVMLGYTPAWVTTGAENLMEHQARIIQRAFGRAPAQHYGMAEAVANCFQCPRERLHVDEDFAAVEFLPGEVQGSARVVGTNFSNPATPLLRYDVGDRVEIDAGSCTCGLPGRLVARVDGREEDYVILANGARLGRMDHIFKDMMAIREAQIVQRAPGRITVRIVRHPQYDGRDETVLREEFRKRVGDLAEVGFEYVERLPRSRNGKLRFVVSELTEGRLPPG